MKTTEWAAIGAYVFQGRDCIAICDTDNGTKAEYERKARLMAAAPDLLVALKALHHQALQSELNSPSHEWGTEALGLSRAALEKAERAS